jgi:hypothetical protein
VILNLNFLINSYKTNKLIVDSEKELARIYDGVPIYFTTDNTESGTTINAKCIIHCW